MTLTEYAAAMEKSAKPSERAVARFIRSHQHRIGGMLHDYGKGLGRADREELVQIAVLACVQAVSGPDDIDQQLKNVRNALHREAHHASAWNSRRIAMPTEENE